MKASTLQSRIKKHLSTKEGVMHSKSQKVIEFITKSSTTVYPRRWTRNGSKMKLVDTSHQYIYALNALGIDYKTGNNVPRCGAYGLFIRLTKKGRNYVR